MKHLSDYLHEKLDWIWPTYVGVLNLNANSSKKLHYGKSYEILNMELDHKSFEYNSKVNSFPEYISHRNLIIVAKLWNKRGVAIFMSHIVAGLLFGSKCSNSVNFVPSLVIWVFFSIASNAWHLIFYGKNKNLQYFLLKNP